MTTVLVIVCFVALFVCVALLAAEVRDANAAIDSLRSDLKHALDYRILVGSKYGSYWEDRNLRKDFLALCKYLKVSPTTKSEDSYVVMVSTEDPKND